MNGTNSVVRTLDEIHAVNVHISEDTLTVDLDDSRTISVPIGWYPRLAHATSAECANWRLVGRGKGIHWPDLDEDIGVEGLLLGKKSSESPASLQSWLSRRANNAI